MRRRLCAVTACATWLAAIAPSGHACAEEPAPTTQPVAIDLPTALRLAGANNLEVQIAEQRVAEARAQTLSAREAFLPWLSAGSTYRRHDGRLQNTEGDVIDVDKHSTTAGATLTAQIDVGNAIYGVLQAHQIESASRFALDRQRADSVHAAALAYFDLARARAEVSISEEALMLSRGYADQLASAVAIGIAFRGDLMRAELQRQRDEIALRHARENQRIGAARLAQILRLDAAIELVPQDGDPVPLALVAPETPLDALLARARAHRPEMQETDATVEAARLAHRNSLYGPLLPSIGAQASAGGLGGGRSSATDNFGGSEDYYVGVGWRIGPGGLFDLGRIRTADARLQGAELARESEHDEITRQVVEALTQIRSLSDQLAIARDGVASAGEGMRLAAARKEFAVGVVLEHIVSQQDLAQAKRLELQIVADYDKAQYSVSRAVGDLGQ